MQITQLRNATVVVSYDDCRILVDPMLANRGDLPSFRWLTRHRRRNPIVDLPAHADQLLDSVTHALITHCRKGHVDHLDRAGARWLRQRQVPVLCMPVDARFLSKRGLNVQPLNAQGPTSFLTGVITPVPCQHGEGWIRWLMEQGHGFFIVQAGEPSLYLSGDTVLTEEVRQCVLQRNPDVSVVPAGGATMDFGSKIIMDEAQVLELAALGSGIVLANHLEALDHCPVSRVSLLNAAREQGLGRRLFAPQDGESMVFSAK